MSLWIVIFTAIDSLLDSKGLQADLVSKVLTGLCKWLTSGILGSLWKMFKSCIHAHICKLLFKLEKPITVAQNTQHWIMKFNLTESHSGTHYIMLFVQASDTCLPAGTHPQLLMLSCANDINQRSHSRGGICELRVFFRTRPLSLCHA